jgi:hypothetical protein
MDSSLIGNEFLLAPTLQFPFNIKTMLTNLTPAQLRKAASIKEQIEALNKELGAILGSTGVSAPSKAAKPAKKGGMSAAGKARIAAAQKARWAKIKAAKGKPVVKAASKPAKKFTMSAAAKAKISAAAKARWAKIKAAKKK